MTNRLVQLLRTQQHRPAESRFKRKIHSAARTKTGLINRRLVEGLSERPALSFTGAAITREKSYHFTKGYRERRVTG